MTTVTPMNGGPVPPARRYRTVERPAFLGILVAAVTIAAAAAAGIPLALFAQSADLLGIAPERVLVAPLPAGGDDKDPLRAALPALVAEAISEDKTVSASLAHDLSPAMIEVLGLDQRTIPDAAIFADARTAEHLSKEGGVRILVLPALEGGKLTLTWRDLVEMKDGTITENAPDARSTIEAAGRAAASAKKAWAASWKPAAASAAATPGIKAPSKPGAPATKAAASATSPQRPLAETTSASPEALGHWATAQQKWNHGDPLSAEGELADALAADKSFARAKIDLAWIRLAQERFKDAAALVAEAKANATRLSPRARAFADIIAAAAARDGKALAALADRLEKESPGAPWDDLARGLALNLTGDHPKAIAPLDRARLHHPNDPFLVHEAGIAAMGSDDFEEAVRVLDRAVSLWPAHDRFPMDLAEAQLRGHDPDGARRTLERWRDRFRPGDPPIWGGEWTLEDPPPPVRAVGIELTSGSIDKAVSALDKSLSILEAGGAPASTRIAVLLPMHELQQDMAFGADLNKQRWMTAARESFRRLSDLMPDDLKKSRPWILPRLEALLRVKENRIPEAEQRLKEIRAMASMPGFDPGIEAEIDAAIALKGADTERHFAACKRAVQARGSLEDLYRLGQGYSLAARWKDAEAQVKAYEDRVEVWSATRRRDAMLWNTRTAAILPFEYSLGGQTYSWLGNVDESRKRFDIFLAYFKAPDEILKPYEKEAFDRGATPAW